MPKRKLDDDAKNSDEDSDDGGAVEMKHGSTERRSKRRRVSAQEIRSLRSDLSELKLDSAGERKEVWSRLNRLARITLPKYGGTAGFYGQFVRVTIGNLYVNVPMYINDLTYSWDAETSWEITPGEQVPFITSVDMSLGWVGNAAPSSTQRAYNYG